MPKSLRSADGGDRRIENNARSLFGRSPGTARLFGGVRLGVDGCDIARPVRGFVEDSGLVFWIGHCDVHDVSTDDTQGNTASFAPPPAVQLNRGGSYHFVGREIWDQAFFYELRWDCIERDGLHHLLTVSRNVTDMTVTSIPWPQDANQRGERDIVEATNLMYCELSPWIVIESIFLIRRRWRAGQPSGEATMLAQLSCAVPLAVLAFGDPRFRSVYDVFGLALLAALLAARFRLDKSVAAGAPSDTYNVKHAVLRHRARQRSTTSTGMQATVTSAGQHEPQAQHVDTDGESKPSEPKRFG